MKLTPHIATILFCLLAGPALAQMPMRPPAFMAGVPGMAQMQSIVMQRHQARTLLYREALEELKKNPAAADVKECQAGNPTPGEVCIGIPEKPGATLQPEVVAKVESERKAALLSSVPRMPQAITSAPANEKTPPSVMPRKIAVLFGNNAYPKPIPALETPISDVQDIGRILQERFGYEVKLVRDARKLDVVNTLNQIGMETKPGDSVLVVYAGHGYLMDDTNMGYWIPVDGSTKSPANWISNTDISKFLKNIQAQQVILISDSCFSGSLTREEKISTSSKNVDRNKITNKRSVLAMSSGGEEPVSDEGKEGHSIFAWSLIGALKSAGALTPGAEIFQVVKTEVLKDYPQEPQYGAVLSAGHMEGGEYLFEAPSK